MQDREIAKKAASPVGWLATVAIFVVVVAASAGFGARVGRKYEMNALCCDMHRYRNIGLSLRETLGLVRFYGDHSQDKWVSEKVFPGVTNGYFVDVGAYDGVSHSNTKRLEEKGWTGLCIEPFPHDFSGRTCRLLKEVVYSETGKRVTFYAADLIGGVADSLGTYKDKAERSPSVELVTITLGDLLDREKAPRFIQYLSIDIEGAELEALRGIPFDKYRFGAIDVEHNYESPKREDMRGLLEQNGYQRVWTWYQDDYYEPVRRLQ